MRQQNHSMLKSRHSEHSLEESEIRHFFYTDLLSYMHKMKIPQVFTLIRVYLLLLRQKWCRKEQAAEYRIYRFTKCSLFHFIFVVHLVLIKNVRANSLRPDIIINLAEFISLYTLSLNQSGEWNDGRNVRVIRLNAFSSKAVKRVCMVGLLTCSYCERLPGLCFPVARSRCSQHNIRTYSSGTVQDLHLIPF